MTSSGTWRSLWYSPVLRCFKVFPFFLFLKPPVVSPSLLVSDRASNVTEKTGQGQGGSAGVSPLICEPVCARGSSHHPEMPRTSLEGPHLCGRSIPSHSHEGFAPMLPFLLSPASLIAPSPSRSFLLVYILCMAPSKKYNQKIYKNKPSPPCPHILCKLHFSLALCNKISQIPVCPTSLNCLLQLTGVLQGTWLSSHY